MNDKVTENEPVRLNSNLIKTISILLTEIIAENRNEIKSKDNIGFII